MKNTMLALVAGLVLGQSAMAENAQPAPAPMPVPSVGAKNEAPPPSGTEKKEEAGRAKQAEKKEGAVQ